MPRTARASVGGLCYHVLNRGNARATVFRKAADYDAFVDLMVEALDERPMRVVGYCLMPNHFHLVLWPRGDGDLSAWMQWLMNAHVRRYHKHYHTLGEGHIWQGRFKAFPIEADAHLLVALRYIERNPVRAGLVERAEEWRWSSLAGWATGQVPAMLDRGPVARPAKWLQMVNRPQTQAEQEAMQRCMARSAPLGGESWVARTAKRLGLEHTMRRRGRPRKAPADGGRE